MIENSNNTITIVSEKFDFLIYIYIFSYIMISLQKKDKDYINKQIDKNTKQTIKEWAQNALNFNDSEKINSRNINVLFYIISDPLLNTQEGGKLKSTDMFGPLIRDFMKGVKSSGSKKSRKMRQKKVKKTRKRNLNKI
jgi:hypothetical protein